MSWPMRTSGRSVKVTELNFLTLTVNTETVTMATPVQPRRHLDIWWNDGA